MECKSKRVIKQNDAQSRVSNAAKVMTKTKTRTEKPRIGPASPVQKVFFDDDTTDIIIFGGGAGSGKTALCQMKVLKYIDDPNFNAIFIRQTHPQLEMEGGIWSECLKLYPKFGAKKNYKPKKFKFPNGANVSLLPCGSDRELENFDGGQFSYIIIDEAQNHSFEQFSYLMGRNRSMSKYPPRMVLTCNPLKGNWLLGFVEWYLDKDTGIPLKELANTIRFFSIIGGKIVTASSAEELLSQYPTCTPKTYRFIPATIFDNPVIQKVNPGYLSNLENLKTNERRRLLLGSWYAVGEDDGHFKRDWVDVVADIPLDVSIVSCVRAWDFACTLASEKNTNPDYTASVKIAKCNDGKFYILDVTRIRARQHDVEDSVSRLAQEDGTYDCTPIIPRDPGTAGKNYTSMLRRKLSDQGVFARESAVAPNKSKLSRFLPFTVVAHGGDVKLIKADWNDVFLEELEAFTGQYKDRNMSHDDMVDACSDAFNNLHRVQKIAAMNIPDLQYSKRIRK